MYNTKHTKNVNKKKTKDIIFKTTTQNDQRVMLIVMA